ncbi:MAG: hypothetical protein ACTSPK_00010 [Candidatus Heimdallarchaeota archaeon]
MSHRPFFSSIVSNERDYPRDEFVQSSKDIRVVIDDLPDNAIIMIKEKNQIIQWQYVGQIRDGYDKFIKKEYGEKKELSDTLKQFMD